MTLCAICCSIPLERLFGLARGPREHEIGVLSHARANRLTCDLCNFWAEAYELAFVLPFGKTGRGHQDLKLRLHIGPAFYSEDDDLEEPWFERAGIWAWNEEIKTGPCLWLHFYSPSLKVKPRSPLICVSCIPAQDGLRDTARLMPRIRDESEISACRLNYSSIQGWINRCSSEHAGLCQQSTVFKRQTLKLRLINAETRQIEPIRDQTRYIALSYVWGMRHRDYSLHFWQSCMVKDGTVALPASLPKTIEDALTLTRNLGLGHLWVDAFCIDQSNAEEVREQLANMHLVFECADLVIAAMDGDHADAGICGISKDLKRMAQPSASTPYGEFTATYVTDIWQEQGMSPWEQRAWTLQELLLAKRILLIHGEYTVMRCQQGIFSSLLEADEYYHKADFTAGGTYFWHNGFDVDLNQSKWHFGNFDNFLANYTRRKLTNAEDVLNACLGALSQITRNTGVGFIQGMPRADLHLALLWKPHHGVMLSRRSGFPSWTWAGWKGLIEHHYCIDDLSVYDSVGPAERQKHVDKGGSVASEQALRSVAANLDAFITDQGEQSTKLRVSSQIASVTATLVRRRGRRVPNLPKGSEQAKLAVGDHWVIMNQSSQPIENLVGEVAQFEAIDYSFQTNSAISAEIQRQDRRCELIHVKYFPHLRDTHLSGIDDWLFDQVGCLVVLRDESENSEPTATRIGAVFMRLQDWLDLDPRNDVITLV